jgi:hypothetical protein
MPVDTQKIAEISLPPVMETPQLPISAVAKLGREAVSSDTIISVGIIKSIDVDGSSLYLPAFQEMSMDSTTFPLPEGGEELTLSSEQKSRLKEATDQNICPLLATHLALNTDLPVSEFARYSSKITPRIISFYGESGVMKSKTMAIVHHLLNLPVFSFDNFSKIRLDSFLRAIDGQPKDADLLNLMSNVEATKSSEDKTLRKSINDFLEFTTKNPNQIYLIDLPGFNSELRNPDIFDVAAYYSLNAYELLRRSHNEPEIDAVRAYLHDIASIMGYASEISAEYRNIAFMNQVDKISQ